MSARPDSGACAFVNMRLLPVILGLMATISDPTHVAGSGRSFGPDPNADLDRLTDSEIDEMAAPDTTPRLLTRGEIFAVAGVDPPDPDQVSAMQSSGPAEADSSHLQITIVGGHVAFAAAVAAARQASKLAALSRQVARFVASFARPMLEVAKQIVAHSISPLVQGLMKQVPTVAAFLGRSAMAVGRWAAGIRIAGLPSLRELIQDPDAGSLHPLLEPARFLDARRSMRALRPGRHAPRGRPDAIRRRLLIGARIWPELRDLLLCGAFGLDDEECRVFCRWMGDVGALDFADRLERQGHRILARLLRWEQALYAAVHDYWERLKNASRRRSEAVRLVITWCICRRHRLHTASVLIHRGIGGPIPPARAPSRGSFSRPWTLEAIAA